MIIKFEWEDETINKITNDEGQQPYNNAVPGSDPKYQIRIFNGQPQFRIRKRQESAKNQINRAELVRKVRDSTKYIDTIGNDTACDNINVTDNEYFDDRDRKKIVHITDVSNATVIARIQSKYGIGIPPWPEKSRKTTNDIFQNNDAKKTFSNSQSNMQESLIEGYYPKRGKISKGSFKKKFSDHNKLPELTINNRLLPKIK